MSAPRPWPPIVSDARLPWWVVARDVVLTLLLWSAFAYGIVSNLEVAGHALRLLAGEAIEAADPMLAPFLGRMARRMTIVLLLVSLLAVATLASIRRHRHAIGHPQPEPVPDADLARDIGLDEAQLAALRQRKVVTLDVDGEGRASVA